MHPAFYYAMLVAQLCVKYSITVTCTATVYPPCILRNTKFGECGLYAAVLLVHFVVCTYAGLKFQTSFYNETD